MRISLLVAALLVAAPLQHACLVADTDCEDDSDCETGRSCQSGECVEGENGFGGSSGSGGSGGGGFGGTGGSGGGEPYFESCLECGNTLCTDAWDNCTGDDITFCSLFMTCLDDCSTSSCSSDCVSQWGFGSPGTSGLRICVQSKCGQSCMNW